MPDVLEYQAKKKPRRGKRVYFWRATAYLRPYKKLVIISIACAMFAGGVFFSGLGALLPVLQTLLNGDTPQMWVDRMVAEQRWGIDLADDPGELKVLDYGGPYVTERGRGYEIQSYGNPGRPTGPLADAPVATQYEALLAPASDDPSSHPATNVDRLFGYMTLKETRWHLRLLRRLVYLLPSDPVWAVAAIMFGVFLLSALANVVRYAQEYLSNTAALSAINDLRRDLYSHALRTPLGYFGKAGTSDVTSRITVDCGQLQEGFRTLLGRAVQEPILAFFALAFALWIDWRLTIFVILFAPPMAVVLKKFGTKMRRAGRSSLQSSSALLGQIESTLAGVRVVKANNAEDHEVGRIRAVLNRLLGDQLRLAKYDAMSTPVMETLAVLALGVVVTFAVYLVRTSGTLSVAGAMLVFGCLIQIAESLRRVSKLNVVLQKANAAGQRIFENIDAPIENSPRRHGGTEKRDVASGPVPPCLRGEFERVSFERVTFRYSPEQPAVLDGVSLTVTKGQSVAVVGRNGSGKTTLLSLLPRFYDPDEGRVAIDGVDVRELPLDALRDLIGVVTQEAIVFPGTIAQNIAYARQDAPREQIEAAAKQAEAHEFILNKGGYDVELTGLGGGLSGGQRQRLNIARAILRDPPILILDEATSQVDAESEHLIQAAISRLMQGRTTFVIAHRFSTILDCDRIALMDDGQLQAVGTHAELLETSDVYRALYDRQLVST